MSSRLRQARDGRGWSQARLIHATQQQAVALDLRLATPGSLKTQISRWENRALSTRRGLPVGVPSPLQPD